MTLNHVNLTVFDALETRLFLEKYFGLRGQEGGNRRYPPTFHIGFIQPSAQHVDAINARLKADGFDVPPPSQQHRSWTFYFPAPGGFVIEVLS